MRKLIGRVSVAKGGLVMVADPILVLKPKDARYLQMVKQRSGQIEDSAAHQIAFLEAEPGSHPVYAELDEDGRTVALMVDLVPPVGDDEEYEDDDEEYEDDDEEDDDEEDFDDDEEDDDEEDDDE